MSPRVSLNELAEAELRDAALYYEMVSHGLGSRLLDVVQSALDQIEAHPLAAAALQGDIRRKLLHGFPYQLLYRCADCGIRVLAEMHARRRPFYWTRRK